MQLGLAMSLPLALLFCLSLSGVCWARDYTFTVHVGRGASECFYDYIHEMAFLEIEYQVGLHTKRSMIRKKVCEEKLLLCRL